jgi:O-antigen/teichoic acid export membrane protein
LLATGKAQISYGIRRVPGDFAIGALFSLPGFLAAHYMSLREGGSISLAASLLTLAVTAASPFSTILLPHSAKLIKMQETRQLRHLLTSIAGITLVFSVLETVTGILLANFGIRLWLGEEHRHSVKIVQIALLGIIPYSFYISFRSVLDAAYHAAVSARNCYIALAAFILLALIAIIVFQSIYALTFAFILSVYLLGGLTCYQAWLLLRRLKTTSLVP